MSISLCFPGLLLNSQACFPSLCDYANKYDGLHILTAGKASVAKEAERVPVMSRPKKGVTSKGIQPASKEGAAKVVYPMGNIWDKLVRIIENQKRMIKLMDNML